LNIIVHYPKSEHDRALLQKRVAEVHVQAIVSYIRKLNCPHYQKIKLIEELRALCVE